MNSAASHDAWKLTSACSWDRDSDPNCVSLIRVTVPRLRPITQSTGSKTGLLAFFELDVTWVVRIDRGTNFITGCLRLKNAVEHEVFDKSQNW